MEDFRQPQVWEKSQPLALAVYQATKDLPKEVLRGLTSQRCRSSMPVPTNVAEGCGKYTVADFARFLPMAIGSARETEYRFLLARDLSCLLNEVSKKPQKDVELVQRRPTPLMITPRRGALKRGAHG